MTAEARSFERSIDSLAAVFAYTAECFERQKIDDKLLPTVDFAVEELFTNMVKYGGASRARVRIKVGGIDGGVEVTMIDYDVEPFDVTKAPDVDIDKPIEERQPGGLGLHLIRRLLDSVDYEYSRATRQSRITFRKTAAGMPGP
jgi:anti-sigma regulatory factor (Ser/Thr protein kinase)